MLTQTQLESLQSPPGSGWIAAVRTETVRQLLDQAYLPRSPEPPFLVEINCPEFPNARLSACFDPRLAQERRRQRHDLLHATEQVVETLVHAVQRRTKTPLSAAESGTQVGKGSHRFHVGKHVATGLADGYCRYARRMATSDREADLDGGYVMRTSESQQTVSAAATVRNYKHLAPVERVLRTLQGREMQMRPIQHRTAARVRAHLFLCLLAYDGAWHLRQAWAPWLFDEHPLPIDRYHRDPLAPAQPAAAAKRKQGARVTVDGWPMHSFTTLMTELGTRCRHRGRLKRDPQSPVFVQDTQPTPLQAQALELIRLLPVQGN
jgi:hypothetical protein